MCRPTQPPLTVPPLPRPALTQCSLSLACLFLASKTEEAPIHAKLLLHYARRLAAKAGVPAPGDTHMLVAAEALLVVRSTYGPRGAEGSGV